MSGPSSRPSSRQREIDALAERYEDELEDRETVVSIFGDTRRVGPWAPPERTRAIAGFANVVLDFTQADLPPGVTDVEAIAIFANVEIRVPASLQVEFSGLAIMGNLVHKAGGGDTRKRLRRWLRVPERPDPPEASRPDAEAVLCIHGTALLGNVVLQVV